MLYKSTGWDNEENKRKMATKKEESHKFWDRVSGWSKAETAANSTLVNYLTSKFGVHIMSNNTVLDFGCGTGTITLRIARNVKKISGVDVSEGMLKRAQQNMINQRIDNADFNKITILEKMFQSESFEVITTFNVMQYVANREDLFDQFYKLLKPKGKLIVAVPCFGDTNSFPALFVRFLKFIHIMPKTYFFRVNDIEKEITDRGLTIIESTNLSNLPEKFIIAIKA